MRRVSKNKNSLFLQKFRLLLCNRNMFSFIRGMSEMFIDFKCSQIWGKFSLKWVNRSWRWSQKWLRFCSFIDTNKDFTLRMKVRLKVWHKNCKFRDIRKYYIYTTCCALWAPVLKKLGQHYRQFISEEAIFPLMKRSENSLCFNFWADICIEKHIHFR